MTSSSADILLVKLDEY